MNKNMEFDQNFTASYRSKQPSTGVFRKKCCENMQLIYRRTPMPKCDFNKVATLLKSHFGMGVFL